jgi:AraC-like DNA-binding protein
LPKHKHYAYEIVFMLAGELSYFVHDRTYGLRKGNILFINTNDLHQNLSVDNSKYQAILIRFSKDFLQTHNDRMVNSDFLYSFYNHTRALAMIEEEERKLEEICLQMIEEFEHRLPDYLFCCHALLTQLLIRSKRVMLMRERSSEIEHPSYLHKKISKIAGYLNSHYMESVTLGTISKIFHISPYYLSRNFKRVTGFSLVEFLNLTRINMAKALLADSSLKITEIADRVGFSSITHFGRTFKTIVGVSPKDYRKHSGGETSELSTAHRGFSAAEYPPER